MNSGADALKLMQLLDNSGDSDDKAEEFQAFLESRFLKTTTLPLGMLGSGNCDLAAKHECLFNCLKLEVGVGTVTYSISVFRRLLTV